MIRATSAAPGPSSIAGLSEQPVLVSSQLDRGSEPPSPAEGLARRTSRASGGTRTRTRPFTGGVLDLSSYTGARGWPAGVEPAQPRFTAGSRCQFEFGHSASTRNRTRNSAFAEPRDVPFTIEASTVPRPGVEPGPAPSEGAMMSLSPPGQRVTREGLEPSRRGGHGLLRTACLPFHHLAISVDRGGS